MKQGKSSINTKITCFGDLFKDNNTQYRVPFFQRGYVWQRNDWDILFQDISTFIFENNIDDKSIDDIKDAKHFFGTIVLKSTTDNDGAKRFTIIDGQQRLMTCYAILLCIYKMLVTIENINESGHESSRVFKETFLINKEDTSNSYNELKIFSTQGDTLSFYRFLNETGNPILPAGLLDRELLLNQKKLETLFNYCDKILRASYSSRVKLDKLKHAILYALEFVCIYVGDDSEAQVIFETLNAKGVALTSSELLCNYIFNEIDKSDTCPNGITMDTLHYDKWLTMQRNLSKVRRDVNNSEDYSDFDAFLRNSISIGREVMLPKGRAIYYKFKEWHQREAVFPALTQIEEDAEHFSSYIKPSKIAIYETNMNKFLDVGIHSVIPFIITLLRCHKNGKLAPEIINVLLKTVLTLLVRQKVSGNNPKYDRFFPNLWNEITSNSNSSDYNKSFLEIIERKHWLIRDEEFIENLKSNAIYRSKDKKFCKYLLRSIDQKIGNHNSEIDYAMVSEIEHILPQTISGASKWKEHLGDELDRSNLHRIIHSIGNLTLLHQDNSGVGDLFIEEKLRHPAYNSDPVPPITAVAVEIYNSNKKWNIDSITARSESLAKVASKIWAWD